VTNLLENYVATMAIATWEKEINRQKALSVLDRGTPAMGLDAVANGVS
jgi:hypothetical protein